jgi:hypothetical protein
MKKFESLTEELSAAGRRQLARNAKLKKSKLTRGRKIASKKAAPASKILQRAARRARNAVAANFLKGKSKGDLGFAARARVEKQVQNRAGLVNTKARKLQPEVRKDDRKR